MLDFVDKMHQQTDSNKDMDSNAGFFCGLHLRRNTTPRAADEEGDGDKDRQMAPKFESATISSLLVRTLLDRYK